MEAFLTEVVNAIDADLKRATEQRAKIRKRVEAGVLHESHLEYSDGLVAGLESAKHLINEVERKHDRR